MQITVNRIGDSITGTFNGKAFGVSYSEPRWNAMQELRARANAAQSMDELKEIMEQFEPLTHESYKDMVETVSPYLHVNPASNRFYLKYNRVISKEPLPQVFVDRILESIEKGIDPKPLIKCWVRFMRNPNYSEKKAQLFAWYINQKFTDPKKVQKFVQDGVTHEKAIEYATVYQTPITDEGLICTYKVSEEITKKYVKAEDVEGGVKQQDRYDYDVDEDTGLKTYKQPVNEDRVFEPAVQHKNGDAWDLFEANGSLFKADVHIIKVGKIHTLKDWKQVDCNDSSSCVPGLHCGNLDYIRSYQTNGTVTHYVFVDPMDIGAVVQDKTGALRVKSYMVYGSFQGVNGGLYHSSTYGKLKDDEYARMVEEVVTKSRQEAIEAVEADFAQKADLVD